MNAYVTRLAQLTMMARSSEPCEIRSALCAATPTATVDSTSPTNEIDQKGTTSRQMFDRPLFPQVQFLFR
jgi:hypothetical protein